PRTLAGTGMALLQRQLREALDLTLTPFADPSGEELIISVFGRNLDGATEGVAPFTLAFEGEGADLDDWLYPNFHTGETMNTYRLQDPQLDTLLERSRMEFDRDTRRKIGLDIQDYLLAMVNALLEYFAPVQRRHGWGYVRNSHCPGG